jgi:hypothetical protein
MTRNAMQASSSGVAALFGLCTSGFDVKQQWPGGPAYLSYERSVLAGPGFLESLTGSSVHPYQTATWVPWAWADGRNASFLFPNETAAPATANSGYNSTVVQLLVVAGVYGVRGGPASMLCRAHVSAAMPFASADAMRAQAATLGLTNYTPVLHPSEVGYALAIPSAVSDGWAHMHAALVAQTLLHMRAAPLAGLVSASHCT